MFPTTHDRVPVNTCDDVNAHIRRTTDARVWQLAAAGPAAVDERLAELDAEWDIERYIETMAPSITLAGLAVGVTVNRKFLLIPAFVQAFLLVHGLQGWCPPVPVLRRIGVRTADEINEERVALKLLRGDFERGANGRHATDVRQLMAAVRR